MRSDCTTIEKEDFQALDLHRDEKTTALARVVKTVYSTILDFMQETGQSCPDGMAPFTRYNKIDWSKMQKRGFLSMLHMLFVKRWDMDIGIPISKTTQPQDDIKCIRYQPGKCLRILHIGPYAKVATAYTRILEKAQTEGLTLADHSYEFYLNNPNEVSSDELKTEILVPLG
jgi:effector-binding domain-containing protein